MNKFFCAMLPIIITLSACDNSSANSSKAVPSTDPAPAVAPAEQPPQEETTPSNLTAKVGFIASATGNAPLNFLNDQEGIQGFEYDILQEIAKRSNYNFSYEYRPPEEIFSNLSKHDLRIIAGNIDINDQIQKDYAISNAYLNAYPVTIISKDPNIKTLAQLKGKRIAIENAPMEKTYQLVQAMSEDTSAATDIHHVKSDWLAVRAVLSGKADAAVSNSAVIPYYVEEYSSPQMPLYFSIDYEYPEGQYGFVLHKEDHKLLQAMNKAIAEMKADGTYQNIFKKWF